MKRKKITNIYDVSLHYPFLTLPIRTDSNVTYSCSSTSHDSNPIALARSPFMQK